MIDNYIFIYIYIFFLFFAKAITSKRMNLPLQHLRAWGSPSAEGQSSVLANRAVLWMAGSSRAEVGWAEEQ